MKRYYFSPIASAPKGDYPAILDVINANGLAPAVGQAIAPIMPIKNADGTSQADWCLVLVNVTNHIPLLTDGRFTPWPDISGTGLDVKWGSITGGLGTAKRAVRDFLVNKGVLSTTIDNADGLREVVRAAIKHLQPNHPGEDELDRIIGA